MKHVWITCLCLTGLAFVYKKPAGYFIFQFEGDIQILSAGIAIPCQMDYEIKDRDSIQIRHGWITLIDGEVKRVTLDKPGSYSPQEIQSYFLKAKASRENKFLSYLYKKMKATPPEDGMQKGGVVRGEEESAFPQDSSVILGQAVRFEFKSGGELPVLFSLKDQKGDLLLQKETTDSTLIIRNDLGWCAFGTYIWTLHYANKMEVRRFFIVPDEAQRKQLLDEIAYLKNSFPDLPVYVRERILEEYVRDRKLNIQVN